MSKVGVAPTNSVPRYSSSPRTPMLMSAFSRGCLLRHQFAIRPRIQPPHASYQPRFFSSVPILRASRGSKIVAPKGKTIPSSIPATNPKAPIPARSSGVARSYESFANTLAKRAHSTLLYEAPSHTMFMITSYGAAGLFLGYGGYTYYQYSDPPDGISSWVPYAFGVGTFLMAAMAGWFIMGPAMLIKSITAVPKSVVMSLGTAAKGGASVPELQLEVELRKMFPVPFFPPRKLYIEPHQLELPTALAAPAPTRAAISLREMEQAEKQREEELEYRRNHILSMPFRDANKAFYSLFANTRRAFVREGFMKVAVKGKIYKLDVTGGWALDEGRGLDKLVAVKRLR
ncbi:hypothetical protein LSUE1_G005760 [Lachnellula suecica]|uniref:Uncharacterized protein n=1 Tax=Lachnellula suecica TaxID=602035 RepID=A0A8T9C502_9HELO|nr:hypothetical protein LSUE1_G005760 [Lachnellula suecica]